LLVHFQKAVEAALKKCNVTATIVGVSVAWNYQHEKDELQESVDYLCNRDLIFRQREWELTMKHQGKKPTVKEVEDFLAQEKNKQQTNVPESQDYGGLRTWMYEKEKSVLGPDEDKEDEVKEEEFKAAKDNKEKKLKIETKLDFLADELLSQVKSSDVAFVVFSTEAEKEEALKALRENGVKLEDDAVLKK
jgi:hypothetical protein